MQGNYDLEGLPDLPGHQREEVDRVRINLVLALDQPYEEYKGQGTTQMVNNLRGLGGKKWKGGIE